MSSEKKTQANPRFIGWLEPDELKEYQETVYGRWAHESGGTLVVSAEVVQGFHEREGAIIEGIRQRFSIDDCRAWSVNIYSGSIQYNNDDAPATPDGE